MHQFRIYFSIIRSDNKNAFAISNFNKSVPSMILQEKVTCHPTNHQWTFFCERRLVKLHPYLMRDSGIHLWLYLHDVDSTQRFGTVKLGYCQYHKNSLICYIVFYVIKVAFSSYIAIKYNILFNDATSYYITTLKFHNENKSWCFKNFVLYFSININL